LQSLKTAEKEEWVWNTFRNCVMYGVTEC